MALTSQELIERKWKSTLTEKGNFILSKYFEKDLTQEEIVDIILKENKGKYKDSDLHKKVIRNLVSKYTVAFKKLGYIYGYQFKDSKTSKFHKSRVYFANIKPFLDYANSSLPKKDKFREEEIVYLKHITASKEVMKIILKYKGKNLIEKTKLYLLDLFVIQGMEERLGFPSSTRKNIRKKLRMLFGLDTKGMIIKEKYKIFQDEISRDPSQIKIIDATKTHILKKNELLLLLKAFEDLGEENSYNTRNKLNKIKKEILDSYEDQNKELSSKTLHKGKTNDSRSKDIYLGPKGLYEISSMGEKEYLDPIIEKD